MPTLLIRCTLHRDLTHRAFADWIDERRSTLTRETSALRHINAGRLGVAGWAVELHGAPGRTPELEAIAGDLVGDLRLLGLKPVVYTTTTDDPPRTADGFAPNAAGAVASAR